MDETHTDVVLIGFQDQGNLGMGYLAAMLAQHGVGVELLDYRLNQDHISRRIRQVAPSVVGFSLIFQFYLPGFRDLARRLRRDGVTAHFTIGGHYPSLCTDEVLAQMPELDSVVRFEGEATLLELAQRLRAGSDWHEVPGIAYARHGAIVETEARPLIQDLDALPLPYRPNPPEEVLGFKALPLLASRGCARRCSFCSIHTFYRAAPGKVVRVRAPKHIVDEMRHLHDDRGVRIYLFQDDDFPLWGKVGRRWVQGLLDALYASGLVGRTIWKISCRAEYIERDLFADLREAGLYLVYMGLESGTETGLDILNKEISVEQNRRAIDILKDLNIMFEYGFMLFDPSSTFASIRNNLAFMRAIVEDGSAAATFCRMLPYGGTPIRDRLREEGRLRGDVVRPDYDFLDPRLNEYHRMLDLAVAPWIHGNGVSHELNWAWHELRIMQRLLDCPKEDLAYEQALAALTADSNDQLFRYVYDTSVRFEDGWSDGLDPRLTQGVCDDLRTRLLNIRNAFVLLNRAALLNAVRPDAVRGPIMQPQIF